MRNIIRNILLDIIIFAPCLVGVYLIDEFAKDAYFTACLATFIQMEIFFMLISSRYGWWKWMLATWWLLLCSFTYPQVVALTMNRNLLWLALICFLTVQVLISWGNQTVKAVGNNIHYLTGIFIRINRYVWTPIMLLVFIATPNLLFEGFGMYKFFLGAYVMLTLVVDTVFVILKISTLLKMNRMQKNGVTDCIMHASVYDDFEMYALPHLWTVQLQLSNMTGHGTKNTFKHSGKIGSVFAGRYSNTLWNYAQALPNKTCVLYWHSRKDRSWSKARARRLKEFIFELEQKGCNIAIVDLYGGGKIYGDENSMVVYLRKNYPYYYANEMDSVLYEVKREKELYRDKLIDIISELEKLDGDKRVLLGFMSNQLVGNITNSVKRFYALMKICESIIHIEALSRLQKVDVTGKKIMMPSMGTYVQLLDRNEIVKMRTHPELIESVRYIDMALVRNGKSQVKIADINYYIICEKLVTLRNRMLGHGTMVYSVSEELVDKLAVVTLFMIRRFAGIQLDINDNSSIIINDMDIKLLFRYKDRLCMYSGVEASGTLSYLDYETGNILTVCDGEVAKDMSVEVEASQEYMEDMV